MSSAPRVVPAILTDSPEDLAKMLRQAESFTDYAQVDIMDGQFVPSRSIGWAELVPLKINICWEAHLMVVRPEEQFEGFQKAGAMKVVFHYEAAPSPGQAILKARRLGLGVGLAINPETEVAKVLPLLPQVDSVLVLAVNPGFYGSKFIPEVLGKLGELRNARADLEIGIDGGIKESNIAEAARAGADVICVGSAIFKSADPAASYRRLVESAGGK